MAPAIMFNVVTIVITGTTTMDTIIVIDVEITLVTITTTITDAIVAVRIAGAVDYWGVLLS